MIMEKIIIDACYVNSLGTRIAAEVLLEKKYPKQKKIIVQFNSDEKLKIDGNRILIPRSELFRLITLFVLSLRYLTAISINNIPIIFFTNRITFLHNIFYVMSATEVMKENSNFLMRWFLWRLYANKKVKFFVQTSHMKHRLERIGYASQLLPLNEHFNDPANKLHLYQNDKVKNEILIAGGHGKHKRNEYVKFLLADLYDDCTMRSYIMKNNIKFLVPYYISDELSVDIRDQIVTSLPKLSHDCFLKKLACVQAVIHTSQYESFGNIFHEAMALNKYIIAPNCEYSRIDYDKLLTYDQENYGSLRSKVNDYLLHIEPHFIR